MSTDNPNYKTVLVSDLIPYARNSRTHSDVQVNKIASSIKEFGFLNPVLIDKDNGIIAGHGRVMAAQKLGLKEVPVLQIGHLSDTQKRAYIIADNRLALDAGWDEEMLRVEFAELADMGFDLELTGFELGEIEALDFDDAAIAGAGDGESRAGNMSRDFGQPPFSVLDTRKGGWQDRKNTWRAKIGDNGESREGTLSDGALMGGINNGVSLLDPVLAELMVGWFGMAGGLAFDPFAGDTVFGYVAGSMGMAFKGIELRPEQAQLNQARCKADGLPCVYYNDSSENMDKYIEDNSVDLVFSCPPYADLEVYSDNPQDLSTMAHDDFFKMYKFILQKTFGKLKDNRFAVIVMGEVRNKQGVYIGTIPQTIDIMCGAGYQFYNELILVNNAGTLPMRAGKTMRASRKIGKMHQNILVFLKGDAKKAVKDLGDITITLGEDDAD